MPADAGPGYDSTALLAPPTAASAADTCTAADYATTPAGHIHVCCDPSHTAAVGVRPPVPLGQLGPAPQPVYVLSSDGSQLYLLDPSKRPANEEPPPYLPFQRAPPIHSSVDNPYRSRASTMSSRHTLVSYPSSPSRSMHVDEQTPLLGRASPGIRWRWAEIVCGWDGGRYFAPLTDRAHWKALAHLVLMNLPLNLLVWIPLVVGVLVGTVLLITLPLGVVIWWLTLIIARWAARIERRLQTRYHDAVFGPPRPLLHYTCIAAGLEGPNVVQERRFLRCSWAMFGDHYSYAALAYFLLIKPLVVLPSAIAFLALLPLAIVLFPLLPIYLRAARAFGWYQADMAMSNV